MEDIIQKFEIEGDLESQRSMAPDEQLLPSISHISKPGPEDPGSSL